MLIQPKIRGFICTTAHPAGCAKSVEEQIKFVEYQEPIKGPKNVLIIGASTGYGLASRIVSTFGTNAKTIGVFYEKAAEEKRTASAGWYNTAAFEKFASERGFYAKSINGDAFSHAIKAQTANLIRQDLGKVDLIIYSLASPRRIDPDTGKVYTSTLKPIGKSYTAKTVDAFKKEVKEITLEPATAEDIENTTAVMGGDDWHLWIDYLTNENLLDNGIITVAYSYIGPELTHPIYKHGTIGVAKDHLKATSVKLNKQLASLNGRALVSINKAVVTQSSSAIPVVPLYISLLFKLMKEKGGHEGCIEQIYRLFKEHLYAESGIELDNEGLIRLDDLEMQPDIQNKINQLWPQVTTENLNEISDVEGYCHEFYRLFGFDLKGVDYNMDSNPEVEIPSL